MRKRERVRERERGKEREKKSKLKMNYTDSLGFEVRKALQLLVRFKKKKILYS